MIGVHNIGASQAADAGRTDYLWQEYARLLNHCKVDCLDGKFRSACVGYLL